MSKKSGKELVKVESIDEPNIDFENRFFDFDGEKFSFITIKEKIQNELKDVIYIKGAEIAKFLEYKNPKEAIRDHVKKEKYDYFIPLVKHKDFNSQFKKAKISNKKIKLIDLWG